jgi:hypothetical protein
MVGIHAAQRWFHGAVLLPEEQSYSRALPIFWQPAFTEKSKPQAHEPCKEWEAAVQFLTWLKAQLQALGRCQQPVLMVADGAYENLKLWQNLPEAVILLARSAKNRVLYHLPQAEAAGRGRKRLYGERAKTPQELWREKKGWQKVEITVRNKRRHLQYRLQSPVLRKAAAHLPLILIVCLSLSMLFRTNLVIGSCPCRLKHSSFGLGSDGKLKWLTVNSKVILA